MLQENRLSLRVSSKPPQRKLHGCHHLGHPVEIASSTTTGRPRPRRKHPREFPSRRTAKSESSAGNVACDIATAEARRAWTLPLLPVRRTGIRTWRQPSISPSIESSTSTATLLMRLRNSSGSASSTSRMTLENASRSIRRPTDFVRCYRRPRPLPQPKLTMF
jgi:hypothetical protein